MTAPTRIRNRKWHLLWNLAALAGAVAVAGEENPEPKTLNRFFQGKLPEAIGNSKLGLNARLRWEHADQNNRDTSDGFTIRTRFGLTTAPLYGFQGMIEVHKFWAQVEFIF